MRKPPMMSRFYIFRGLVVGLMALVATPSMAFTDGPVTAAIAMEQKVYDEFMRLQVVQQLKTLRDNYVASERYYAMMREMTGGKGVAANLSAQVVGLQNSTVMQVQNQFRDDWVKDPAYGSQLDQAVNSSDGKAADAVTKQVNKLLNQMQTYGSTKIQVAEAISNSSIQNQNTGKQLAALSAQGTADKPISNADLLKALALLVQVNSQTNILLAQLLDVNSHVAQVEMNQQAALLKQSAIVNNIAIQSGTQP